MDFKYTDENRRYAPRRRAVSLIQARRRPRSLGDHIDLPVEDERRNLSPEQKELLVLTRVIIRQSQIILCDGSTNNIDLEADQSIQETMRDCFKGSTIICIARGS